MPVLRSWLGRHSLDPEAWLPDPLRMLVESGRSFGFNRNEGPEQTLDAGELVHLLVELVSKNGNFLVNVGPRADGTISDPWSDVLRGLGSWLSVNGEVIYASRPWVRSSAVTGEGLPVFFTAPSDAAFAILPSVPSGVPVTILLAPRVGRHIWL